MLAQLCERLRLQPRNFQLDIEKRPMRKLPQNIFQRGQRQGFRSSVRNLHSADSRVVADHSLPVSRPAHVKLKPVAPMLQTKLK